MANKPGRLNRLFYGVGLLVFVVHFFNISIYAVDIPVEDEWGGASFYPKLQEPELNWKFIFHPHNTHLIAPTRLSYWAMHRAADLNFATLALMSFLLFAILCFYFLRTLEARFKIPMGHFFPLLATSAMFENHFWGFGSQFHFCLLFFFLAVHFATFESPLKFLSPVWIGLSLLSFSSGVPYAISLALLFALLALMRRQPARNAALCLASLGMIYLWFQQTRVLKKALPSAPDADVGDYFANLLSSGFGYATEGLVPGVLIGLLFLGVSLWLATLLRSVEPKLQLSIMGLLTLVVGLLGGLAATSMGRVEMNSPKTPRYVELGIFLVPLLWLMVTLVVRRFSLGQVALSAILTASAIVLMLPFADTFDYRAVYRPLFHQRQVTAACVRRHLRRKTKSVCPIPFDTELAKHIAYAKKIHLLYTERR